MERASPAQLISPANARSSSNSDWGVPRSPKSFTSDILAGMILEISSKTSSLKNEQSGSCGCGAGGISLDPAGGFFSGVMMSLGMDLFYKTLIDHCFRNSFGF